MEPARWRSVKGLVGVAAFLGIHRVEAEVVEDEEIDGDHPTELGLVAVQQARLLERLEQLIGAYGEDGASTPRRQGFIDSFNGRFRDECLNEHWLTNLHDTRRTIEEHRREYNTY
jgi:hypothetical protein